LLVADSRGSRGALARKARSFFFKRRALRKLAEYEAAGVAFPFMMAATAFGVNKSLITRWRKEEKYINQQCKCRKSAPLTKRQPFRQAGQWKDVQDELASFIRGARLEGKAVSMLYVRLECKRIFLRLHPDEFEQFRCCRSFLDKFLCRNGFALRRKTNGKTESVEQRLNGIKRFHARLRKRLVADQAQTNMFDVKWGAYRPQNRYSVDQVPLPLCNPTNTVDDKGAKRVWIAGTKNDDSQKRFCTLQIAVRLTNQQSLQDGSIKPGTRQPKLTFCFRGKGLRISQYERDSWHQGVNVQFQDKAWYNEPTAVDWAIKHFSEDVKEVSGVPQLDWLT
jgi:hypothetical protein